MRGSFRLVVTLVFAWASGVKIPYGYDERGKPKQWYEIDAIPAWKSGQTRTNWVETPSEAMLKKSIRRINDVRHDRMPNVQQVTSK